MKTLLIASQVVIWPQEPSPNFPLQDKCQKSYRECATVWFECIIRKPFSIAFLPCVQMTRWRTFSYTYLTQKNIMTYFCCLTLALTNHEKSLIHSLCGVSVAFPSVYHSVLTLLRHHYVFLRKELDEKSLRRIVSFSQKFLLQDCN